MKLCLSNIPVPMILYRPASSMNNSRNCPILQRRLHKVELVLECLWAVTFFKPFKPPYQTLDVKIHAQTVMIEEEEDNDDEYAVPECAEENVPVSALSIAKRSKGGMYSPPQVKTISSSSSSRVCW
jgi:hypothetical protein